MAHETVNEFKAAVLAAVARQAASIRAGRAEAFGPQTASPLNPTGAPPDAARLTDFATGYDSGAGTTVVAFTWGLSTWGGGDVWTGS